MTALAPNTDPETERELRLTIVVHGRPAPQGSKKYAGHRRNAASGRISAVLVEQSKRVKPWRSLVTAATRTAVAEQIRKHVDQHGEWPTNIAPLDGPLEADIVFTVLKPTSAPKRRRTWPTTRHSGDVDKLIRSTFDGIADAEAVVDDSRIIAVTARKTFPGEHPEALDQPGAIIRLYTLPGDPR
ncbi:RusA family crossover junction endodeoxyribonuclease [Streptomyces coelicolor]|nr:RusA family crossover junction endodeoxyribonuclease [Streptomyces coelicolor]